jgi:hypothetical protein
MIQPKIIADRLGCPYLAGRRQLTVVDGQAMLGPESKSKRNRIHAARQQQK